MPRITRRSFLAAAGLAPLAAAIPRGMLARALAGEGELRFFEEHGAAVVREATARLIPGPSDDPAEAGHAGAREANVVRYIDTLLGAFAAEGTPLVYAGGPWSDRSGGDENHMATFVPLSARQEAIWRARIARLQEAYVDGIARYDEQAGGDFTAIPPATQDLILSGDDSGFRDLLFTHAIEGMLSIPEYGGNEDLVGWREISWRGDTQPDGWSDVAVASSDGLDPVEPQIAATVAAHLEEAARMIARARWGG